MSDIANTSEIEVTPEPKPFGWTPFEDMSRDELVRQCQRLYAATSSLSYMGKMLRAGDEHGLYWAVGSGGRALEMGEQALAAADANHAEEATYDTFYRYAVDLLFEDKPELALHSYWSVCPKCHDMLGSRRKADDCSGKVHKDVTMGQCDGVMRPLTWHDLRVRTPEKLTAKAN